MTAVTALKTGKRETDTHETDGAAALPTPGAVRKEADLSISEMASLMGMSTFGYEQWESGSRRAGGPAYRLLHLISRDGKPVIEALREVKD